MLDYWKIHSPTIHHSNNPLNQIYKELEKKITRQNAELKALTKKQAAQINELKKELKLHKPSTITEQTLIESEKKFWFIFEKAGLGIIYADNKANVLEVNDAMLKILDTPREQIISHHSSTLAKKFISVKNIGQLAKTIQRTIVGKPIKPFQLRFKEKMLEISATHDRPNKKIIGIIKDISKNIETERALKESEETYRLAMDATTDGLWDWNITTGKVYYSPAWLKILNLTDVVPEYSAWESRIHPDDKAEYLASLQSHLKGKTRFWSCEHRLKIKSAEWKWVLGRGKVEHRDSRKNPLRMVGTMTDISDRKLSEKIILESEKRFRQYFETNAEYCYMISLDGKILDINKSAQKMLGYRRDEIIGRPLVQTIYSPASQEKAKRLFEKWKKTGKLKNEEINIITKNGKERTVILNVDAVKDSEGNFIHSTSIQTDITARKKAEEVLRQSENEFRLIWEKSPVGKRLTDAEGKIIRVNETYCRLVGKTKSKIEGKPLSIVYEPSDHELILKKYKERFENKRVKSHFQAEVTLWNGKKIWFDVKNSFFSTEKGGTLLLGVFVDITDRKVAEKELQKSETKFRTYVENSPTSIFINDKNGHYQFVNHAACELTGYSKTDLLQMSIADLSHTEKLKDRLSAFQELLNTGRSRSEITIKKKDGSKIYIMLNAVKLTENSFIGFGEDITRQKEDEEKIKKSLQEKEILLREIHHRVKNNLQVIASLLSLQSLQVKDKADLKLFQDSRDRVYMIAAVHEKLYQSDNFALINVKELLEEVVTMIYNSSNIREHVNLKIEISDIILSIDDSIPLALIVNELITNSIKYAFPENKTGTIKIHFGLLDEDTYQLIFQDDGIGIPININFHTTNTLGLHLVRMLAKQIKGDAILEQDEWTTFKIIFKGYESVK